MPNSDTTRGQRDWIAIIFAILFPTLVTLVYFQWLKDYSAALQQTAYSIGKVIQFGFPVVWTWVFYRQRLFSIWRKQEMSVASRSGRSGQIWLGIGFGLMVVAAMFTIYFVLVAGTEVGGGLTLMVQEKVKGAGIGSFGKYLSVGVFYALCHSFLEEYYWRWFVFDYLKKFTSLGWSIVVSSLGFALHHVILLAFFFGWASPLTYLFSVSIAVGGAFWAWQYHKTDRLVAPWISHLIVDAGIFALGYWLVKDLFV